MNEENQCCDACGVGTGEAKGSSLDRMVRRFWAGLCRWCFLNIWCRHCYRHVMRLLHRFNLHYAPPTMMSPRYGQRDHWCQWCGLRGHTWTHDPNAPLSPNDQAELQLVEGDAVVQQLPAKLSTMVDSERVADQNADNPLYKVSVNLHCLSSPA